MRSYTFTHALIRPLSIIALVFTTSSCHDTTSSQSPTTPPHTTHLTIIAQQGISGSHTTSTTLHRAGTRIPYAFHADLGFTNTLAFLDSTYVDTIGTITMDRDHTLIISADQTLSIPQSDAPIANALRKVLTATNAPAAFQSLITTLDTLSDTTDIDARLQHIIHATIDPIRDSAALESLANKLANHSFTITQGVGSARRHTPPDSTPPDGEIIVGNYNPPIRKATHTQSQLSELLGEEPVIITHINGILTDPTTALQNTLYIANILKAMTWPAAIPYTLNLLYNPSSKTPPDQRASLHRCLSALADRSNTLGINSLPLFFAKCAGKTVKEVLSGFDDLREAAWQYFKLITNTRSPEPHATVIADSTTHWRNQGNHVLYVAHSQGNMMVQEAVNLLTSRTLYNPPKDSTCLGVVSLAAPLSSHWPISAKHVQGLAVEGDLILSLKTNDFPRSTTTLSDSATRDIKKWDKINPLVAAYKRVIWGLRLHSLIEGYLHPSALRPQFESAIAHTYGSCALNTIEPIPYPIKLQPNQSAQASAQLYDFNHSPLDGTRSLFWSLERGTPSTAAATISSTGGAVAHYVGSVGTRVSSHTRTATSAIEVSPIPLTVIAQESAFTEYLAEEAAPFGNRYSLGRSEWSGGPRCDGRILMKVDDELITFGQVCQYQYTLSVPYVPNAKTYEFLLFNYGSTSYYLTSIRTSPSATVDRFGASTAISGGTDEAPKPVDRIHVIAKDGQGNTLAIGVTCLRDCVGWPNKPTP